LEREVVSCQRLHGVDPAHAQCRADAALLAEGRFLEQQLLHSLEGRDLAAVEPGYAVIDDLDRARHLEADHAAFDAIEQRG
jgi:hypothetical protein